jgi:hypothetical protein
MRGPARSGDEALILLEHQELRAGDPDELDNLACGLALCIPIVAKGQSDPTLEQRAELAQYADRAMAAPRHAVAAGFRDASHMSKDPRPPTAPGPR